MDSSLISLRSELSVLDNVHFGTTQGTNQSFYALTLHIEDAGEIPYNWHNWRSGQFVMLRPLSWGNEVLWARPFSIARVTSRGLVLFFQTMGKGTQKLASLVSGDKVIIWGPLGNGFHIEEQTPTLLIAGGIGLVPFCGYMDQHNKRANLHMLFGHKAELSCYPVETVAQHIEVDTYHEKKPEDLQVFLDAIRKEMIKYAKTNGLVLACGPMGLLQYVWKLSQELKVRTQLSLENKMACGVGACLGCVAKTSKQWPDKVKAGLPVQTCTAGPVFWANEIELG